MCPLISAPNRGYADYQRVDNWDSGTLWSTNVFNTPNQVTSPVLDVSRYGYVGGRIAEALSQSTVQFTWFADAAATIQVNVRTFQLSNSINNWAQLRIPNLGPFLTVAWTPIGGVNATLNVYLFGTNRVHPLEFIPESPIILNQQNIALGAGNTNFYPVDYYSGPMNVWSIVTTATVTVVLQSLTTGGLWTIVDQWIPATSPGTTRLAIAPSGAWRLQAANGGGAIPNFYLVTTPSFTGAS